MKHLIRFTSLAALGGWLISMPVWAGDANETPAASPATTLRSASDNAAKTGVQRVESETAKAGNTKVDTGNSDQASADPKTTAANTAIAPAPRGTGAAASVHASAGTVNTYDRVPVADNTALGPGDPLAAAVIDDAALSNARGGADTHLNQNTSTGAVTGNVASQLTTGSNTISEGSFSNTSGIPIVIQNSGNNVLIQNSTILNLQLESPK